MKFAFFVGIVCIFFLVGCVPDAKAPLPSNGSTVVAQLPSAAPGVQALPENTNGVQIITFGEQKANRSLYDPLIERFNSQSSTFRVQFVEIDKLFESFTTYDDFVERLVRTADVIPLGWSTPLTFRGQLQQNLILDLAPFAAADPSFNRSDFYPGLLQAVTFDGKLAALPTYSLAPIIQYNKALWAQNHLPAPTASITWPELRAAATQIARQGDGNSATYGYVDSYSDNLLAIELTSASHDLTFTPANQVQLDQPEVISALDRVAQLAQANTVYLPRTPPPGTESEHKQISRLIQDQRIGIWGSNDAPFDPLPFAVGTLPAPLDVLQDRSLLGYAISGGTRNPEAAWRWLAFLSANMLTQATTVSTAVVPARQSIAERDGYWAKLDPEATDVVKAILARPPVSLPSTDSLLFATFRDTLFGTALRAVASGKQTSAQAIAEAQTTLNQRLSDIAGATPAPISSPLAVDTPVPQPTAQAVPVTFGVTTLDATALQPLIQDFEQHHPEVALHVQSLRGPNARSLAVSAAAADCFEHFYVPTSDAAGILLDLQPLADADATFPRDDYPPALLVPFQRESRLYGLPFAFDLPALQYNPDVFAAANATLPTATWSFADVQAAAQKLTTGNGPQKHYGLALLGDTGAAIQELLYAQGVSLTKPDGTPNFTIPAVQEATHALVDLLRNTSPHKRLMVNHEDSVAAALVGGGHVGIWLDPQGVFTSSLITTTGVLVPLPGTSIPQLWSNLYIAARSTQPEACWTWLRFLSEHLPATGFPARRTLAESEAFAQQAPEGAAAVYAAAVPALQRRDVLPFEFNPRWLTRALDQVLQGKNLERELSNAQRATEAYIACVHGGSDQQTCIQQADARFGGG